MEKDRKAGNTAIDANFKRIELGEATMLLSLKRPNNMIWISTRINAQQLVIHNKKGFLRERAGICLLLLYVL